MKSSTIKKALIVGVATIAILTGTMVLIVTSLVKGNEWFIQLTINMIVQTDKPIQVRIDEWKPILRGVQADKTPNRAFGILNTMALTYANEYGRTGKYPNYVELARWICEQNQEFLKKHSNGEISAREITLAERIRQRLFKDDAAQSLREAEIPLSGSEEENSSP